MPHTEFQSFMFPSLHEPVFSRFSSEIIRSSSFRIQNPSVWRFSHHQTVFTENVQWRVTCYFHFILSRKKNHTTEQERLNFTKATFQLSPKPVVSKFSISYLDAQFKQQQKGFHTDYEQNMQVLEKDSISFPSRTKETDLNTSKPTLKVSSSL